MNREFSNLLASARRALAAGQARDFPALCDRLRGLAGTSADCWLSLGRLLREAGDTESATEALGRAVELAPDRLDGRLEMATLLRATGRPAEALDQVEAACRTAPSAPEPAHFMGVLCLDQGLTASAVEWLLRARASGADSPAFHADLGLALQSEGRLEDAERSYHRALATDPAQEVALRGLARLARLRRRPEAGLSVLEPLAATIRNGGLLAELAGLMGAAGRQEEARSMLEARLPGMGAARDRMEIHFRLAEFCDAADEPGMAMEHLLTANRLKGARFDPEHYAGLMDRLITVFNPADTADFPRARHDDERPVFIVGMPRSGTSLVEQILASHSRVHGAGELADMGLLALSTADSEREYPESIRTLGQGQVEHLAATYRKRLDELAPASARITDKMWQNFEFLGFAALLFPGSRVIHCTRDPMDTCLSCFFQHFSGTGMAFAYDLAALGAYYRQYRRVMDHWQSVLGLPILEVNYERLVKDPEAQIRTLVEFLGLDWEAACLRFFDTERIVRTASLDQVRRPIYDTSVGRARRYARWLEPLAKSLQQTPGANDPKP